MAGVPFDNKFIVSVMQEIEDNAVERMTKIAIRAHSRLVVATPVDIGQARAGWNFTLNERNETIPKSVKRPKGTTGPLIPAPKSVPNKVAKKTKDVYHVSNFVPHLKFLNEDGASPQQEAGFVDRELRAAVADVEGSS